MWRCPHCGTPQAETARCWVCRRSSSTCSTCRHFRTSLAADVGYCGNDRWRTPLTGLELRACWEEGRRPAPAADARPAGPTERRPVAAALADGGPLARPDPMRLRGFVPLDELVASSGADVGADVGAAEQDRHTEWAWVAGSPAAAARDEDTIDDWERRVSLFGELEG